MRAILWMTIAALCGCANGPIKLNAAGERQITERDSVKIAIAQYDKQRIDPYLTAFFGHSPQPVETGPIWSRGFVGGAGDPQLTIKSAELRQSIAAAGFTTRWTYVAECELSYNGTLHQIHAEGTRAAAMAYMSAMRQAVELGVLDATKKVKNILLGE